MQNHYSKSLTAEPCSKVREKIRDDMAVRGSFTEKQIDLRFKVLSTIPRSGAHASRGWVYPRLLHGSDLCRA